MCNYVGICKSICSYNLVYNFLIYVFPLQSSVFVAHFSNVFWNVNKAFPKVKLLLSVESFICYIAKYKGVKICFQLYMYQNQVFSLVSHSCHLRLTRVVVSPPPLSAGNLWFSEPEFLYSA